MNKKGFTLIEIILTVAFLLILTLLVAPNMYQMINSTTEQSLKQTEALIIMGAKKYISEDKNTARNVKNKVDGYNPFYISVWNLANLDYISNNIKDPTQRNVDYEYDNIVEISFNNTASQYEYEIIPLRDAIDLETTDGIEIIKRITKLFETYKIRYSGVEWTITNVDIANDKVTLSGMCLADYNNQEHLMIGDCDSGVIVLKGNIYYAANIGGNTYSIVGDY